MNIFLALLLATMVARPHRADSQRSTNEFLLVDHMDFRLGVLSKNELDQAVASNRVVLYSKTGVDLQYIQATTSGLHSLSEIIRDMLSSRQMQIRIVKHNLVIQNSIGLLPGDLEALQKAITNSVVPGDIVVVCVEENDF